MTNRISYELINGIEVIPIRLLTPVFPSTGGVRGGLTQTKIPKLFVANIYHAWYQES
ncbi:MAG: hypothetical protein F6K22_31025 [Okeania sp. SIO2F4]|uniref:hypothetical protein n=1 Tax=Okeania sp. SIO2F4 TaxID=2607790 RepID=UPI0014295BD4|nr:hypothetical protein [Okeania sp. SIO2F4]NES06860.1 hypothetical protein [Okeania sp. SIO2F4]